uniref:Calcium-activated chloride channel regulator 1-like n=1 Tax=Saccoglossus kowalevskii TaxID=10224 RepID=A0ABM0GKI6_SACKO|nr:PREDICTED: calcium-activated chloride channel regulator 1-like [Saccoglossus kowalevskii]
MLGDVYGINGRAHITLECNGYTGLLIAIHEQVPEDLEILERLRVIFTDASKFLYEASRHYAYFHDVTILVPETWSDDPAYERATWETYDIANVLVDEENPEWWHNPYTKQTLPCGKPGEYIHITPKWITDVDFSTYLWGDSGKVIIHEWGHLRWGLFDEYPTSPEENFYFDENGRTEPTRCSESVTGVSLDSSKGWTKCNTDPDSGVLPEPTCLFYPFLEDNPATASYLYAQYLEGVVGFCHDDPDKDPDARHNRLANNQQNKQCGHRSCWEVMREHTDFVDSTPTNIVDTLPFFKVVIERHIRSVLVMDVSGSMFTDDRIHLLVQAATRYIRYTLPLGSWLGMVEFSTSSRITLPLTQITDDQVREDLIDMLPKIVNGHTCIGCALLDGIEVLDRSTEGTEGGRLFLITDGLENYEPFINDVIGGVIKSGVVVDTLALSDEADPQLTMLSQVTGGRSYYYSESEISTALHDAFISSVVDKTPSSSRTPVQIGAWTYKIMNDDSQARLVEIAVESKSSEKEEIPMKLTCTVDSPLVVETPPYTAIYAELRKGHSAVINAKVVANVERPGSNSDVKLRLFDNGGGADITSDDGVYSAYFLDFVNTEDCITACRYNVKVESIDTEGRTGVQKFSLGSGALPTNYSVIPSRSNTLTHVGDFDRTSSGGVIQLADSIIIDDDYLAADNFPPSRIVDLGIKELNLPDNVQLKWTATGDDLDQGKASRYDLRFSTSFSELFSFFYQCSRINDSMLTEGTLLSPRKAGFPESVTVSITTSDSAVYYFAIIAVDDAGRSGNISNIVSVSSTMIAGTNQKLSPMARSARNVYDITTEPVNAGIGGIVVACISVLSIVIVTVISIVLYILPRRLKVVKDKLLAPGNEAIRYINPA